MLARAHHTKKLCVATGAALQVVAHGNDLWIVPLDRPENTGITIKRSELPHVLALEAIWKNVRDNGFVYFTRQIINVRRQWRWLRCANGKETRIEPGALRSAMNVRLTPLRSGAASGWRGLGMMMSAHEDPLGLLLHRKELRAGVFARRCVLTNARLRREDELRAFVYFGAFDARLILGDNYHGLSFALGGGRALFPAYSHVALDAEGFREIETLSRVEKRRQKVRILRNNTE